MVCKDAARQIEAGTGFFVGFFGLDIDTADAHIIQFIQMLDVAEESLALHCDMVFFIQKTFNFFSGQGVLVIAIFLQDLKDQQRDQGFGLCVCHWLSLLNIISIFLIITRTMYFYWYIISIILQLSEKGRHNN